MIPYFYLPISTRIILRNTIKRSRMLNQLLLIQNVQISIVFLSVKSIIMKIKEWHHVSLTSNISAKTWSNCTSRGCFENVRTSRFQIFPWFWKLTKICGSKYKIQQSFLHYCIYHIFQILQKMININPKVIRSLKILIYQFLF